MFNKHFTTLCVFVLSLVSYATAQQYGISLRGVKEQFAIYEDGSFATNIQKNSDGSVSWIASAAGGAGGGVAFYVKSNKQEINIANYQSVDLEFDYSPVNGKWNNNAKTPSFAFRILPYDSTGMFGGFEDVEYFDTRQRSGSFKYTVKIPSNFAQQIIASSDYDAILGFALKFDDFGRGNSDGDQIKVTLKNVSFNAKSGASQDVPFDDGLTDEQRGTVQEIYYPSKDYTAQWNAQQYNKHAWVYLPAGYDASDKNTQYPLFVLLHGYGQNENTWGLSNKGRGGKIKGFMDRGMASGDVGRFILVTVTGVASKNWGPNGSGTDFNGFNAFKGELRDDIIPYMRKNYNIKSGRDNVALAGLSMGGGQTFNIGIGECLDMISNFAGFSPALFTGADEFKRNVESKFGNYKIKNLYMTCGTNDSTVYSSYPGYVNSMRSWSKIENFNEYTYPGGTHDFPVWYKGFNDFIHIIFPEMRQKIEITVPQQYEQPEEQNNQSGSCSSRIISLGYPCCSPGCIVYYVDDDGTWGIENDDWCGCNEGQKACVGAQGYPCCKSAQMVYYTDEDGNWSIENGDWCLLQY